VKHHNPDEYPYERFNIVAIDPLNFSIEIVLVKKFDCHERHSARAFSTPFMRGSSEGYKVEITQDTCLLVRVPHQIAETYISMLDVTLPKVIMT
jgi:hypothetical protein